MREDRQRVRNRMQALLATQGIRLELSARFLEHLATAQTGDGRVLPAAFRLRLEREWVHLEAIKARMAAVTATRDDAIAGGTDRVATVARQLCAVRGVAEISAAVFSAELFGTRTFRNGRQLGAVLGLVPVPYRRDQRVQDRGISRAGRADLRRIALQLAWCRALGRVHTLVARRSRCFRVSLRGNRLIDGAARPSWSRADCSWCAIADNRERHG